MSEKLESHRHFWQYPGFEDESTHTRYCKTCGVKAVYPRPTEEGNLWNGMGGRKPIYGYKGGRPKGSKK